MLREGGPRPFWGGEVLRLLPRPWNTWRHPAIARRGGVYSVWGVSRGTGGRLPGEKGTPAPWKEGYGGDAPVWPVNLSRWHPRACQPLRGPLGPARGDPGSCSVRRVGCSPQRPRPHSAPGLTRGERRGNATCWWCVPAGLCPSRPAGCRHRRGALRPRRYWTAWPRRTASRFLRT